MKKDFFVIIFFATLLFSACKPDDSIGLSIQPPQDAVKVVVDTFWLASTDFMYDSISAQCNDSLSMLLGEYYSAKYGSTKAELIVQIAPPINFQFPDETIYPTQPDSVAMILSYSQWFGSSAEPLEISVYQLDKATPHRYDFYPATFDVSDFINVNSNLLLGSQITTSIDQSLPDSIKNSQGIGTARYTKYKFDDVWTQSFFDMAKQKYSSADDFINDFKGFYITTTYGQSTMLYLSQIDVMLYYHYTYQKNGRDTIVKSYVPFPANKEVRQLNKISHINTQNLINKRDSVNYIKTGGGIYPKIGLPIGAIRTQMKDSIGNKIRSINSAILSVEATEIDSSKIAMPIPPTMLLLAIDDAKEFFETNGLNALKNNKAAIASYNYTKNEYTFDLAKIVTDMTRSADEPENEADKEAYFQETKQYILVPVDVYYTDSGGISDIKPQKYVGAITIRSGKNGYSPMRLELVYSGF